MKKFALSIVNAAILLASVTATADNRIGFGVDRGLGVTAQLEDTINLFVGNDGLAVDYLFAKERWQKLDSGQPIDWYVGGGMFYEWGGEEYGIRVPFGLEAGLSDRWQAYAQIAPDLDFEDGAEFGVQAAVAFRYQF